MNQVNIPVLIILIILQVIMTSGGAAIALLSQDGVSTVQDVSQAAWIVVAISGVLAGATTALAKIQNPGKTPSQ